MPPRYEFSFDPRSPYGHLVDLVVAHVPPGLVIDLGCGHAAIAGPLHEHGYQYAGADMDPATVDALTANGIEAHRIDLSATDALADAIVALAAGRPVVAVTALDVVEHLPRPVASLRAVHAAMARLGAKWLGLSIPNVAHVDLAAKLLAGRWDVTPTGLLDDTHISLFTEQRLRDDLDAAGFSAGPAKDFHLEFSDQHFPTDLATLAPAAPLARLVRAVRGGADAHATTNQFVRLFLRTDAATPHDTATPNDGPFLSVVVRSGGDQAALTRTIDGLAAQTCTDFEVLRFDDGLSVASLNRAVETATGHHLAILDAGAEVLPNWVAEFREALDDAGSVLRSRAVVRNGADTEEHTPARFDLLTHLTATDVPIHAHAFPLSVFRHLGLRFDPTVASSLERGAELLVLLQAAQWCGVTDTEAVTVVHRPTGATSVAELLDRTPLLLPEGSAARVAALLDGAPAPVAADVESSNAAARERVLASGDFRTALAREGVATRTAVLLEELAVQRARADRAEAEVAAFERSRVWRATKPVRVVLQAQGVRRLGGKVKRLLRR